MTAGDPTDTDVIARIKQGQVEAFGILVGRYQARIRALVAHYVINRDDAYDIVQDVFLEAFRHINRFDTDGDFLPWLRAICRHRLLHYFRDMKTRYAAVHHLICRAREQKISERSGQNDISLERVAALKRCTHKLGQHHRRLVHLRYHTEATVKDIAKELGQTAAGISMRLYRIRTLLAQCMERELAQVDKS